MKKATSGFTIVELLIVIVVIAILAAITIVAYNGIQQRANNAAVIDAASKSLRMLQAYASANSSVPATSIACITLDSGCATGSATVSNATFNASMATIGVVPKTVPKQGSDHYGVIYYYNAARVVSGSPAPIAVLYWLQGTGQQCGLPNILADPNVASTTFSTTGYTASNDSSTGKTLCAPSLPNLP